jgi:hypothetical protein
MNGIVFEALYPALGISVSPYTMYEQTYQVFEKDF